MNGPIVFNQEFLAAGGDKALKDLTSTLIHGALITYYDHLNRTSLLQLNLQVSHHIHAGSNEDKIIVRSHSPKAFTSLGYKLT